MKKFKYGCEIICNENDVFPAMKVLVNDGGTVETAESAKNPPRCILYRSARQVFRHYRTAGKSPVSRSERFNHLRGEDGT